jgi:signal transduction histidine kinase
MRALVVLLLGFGLLALGFALLLPSPAGVPPPLREVERIDAHGAGAPVRLPLELVDDDPQRVVALRVRWHADLGPRPAALAIYASGLLGSPRLEVNGAVLVDAMHGAADQGGDGRTVPPRPRGRAALWLLPLPDSLLRSGANAFELEVVARHWVSLSPLWIGDRDALQALHDRKLAALVTGPQVVAATIGLLGVFTLLLWSRQPRERQFAYFGAGAVLWALHTVWSASPDAVLAAPHYRVWWTTLYAAIVVLLVLFALQFAQRREPRVERGLLGALLTVPALLYGAGALGLGAPAADALRLSLVLLAGAGLLVVARHAAARRSLSSALFVLAGLVSVAFGLRDWLVFRSDADNYPVAWTPYAGAPFIVLVSWVLLDRFVRTAQSFERMNRQLEERIAVREAELAANFERLARLERAQAAGTERQRLMRELHDGLGAKLVQLRQRIGDERLDAGRLDDELAACLDDMRIASETLTPEATELGAAVGNFLFRWDGLLRAAGVRADWQVRLPDDGLRVAPYAALQLLRVMQEALVNVLRHSEASRVRLGLAVDGGELRLVVEDDGRGIEPHANGRGLQGMQGRTEAIGGRFGLATPAGGGTRLTLAVPLGAIA